MKTRVQKWGNSLALRIPKSLADETGIRNESSVELSVLNNKLVIKPVTEPKLSLKHLLEQVSAENMHHEVETSPAAGNETW